MRNGHPPDDETSEGFGAARHGRAATAAQLWPLLRAEWLHLVGGTVLLLLGSAGALIYPQGLRVVVDGAVDGRGIGHLHRAALLLGAVAALQGIAAWGRTWFFNIAGERGVRRLREKLFSSLMSQDIAFFDSQRTGDLTSRLTADTAALQGLLSSQLSVMLKNAAQVVGALVLLFSTSAKLTCVMLLVIPPVALGTVRYGRRIRLVARLYQDALAEAGHVAEESLSAIRTVRTFAAERMEARRYSAAIEQAYMLARQGIRAAALFNGASSTTALASVSLVLGYGGVLAAAGAFTVGALAAFLVYTVLIAWGLAALADSWVEVMRELGAAARVFELLERAAAMPVEGGRTLRSMRGGVKFEKVRFRYPSRPDVEVLAGIDLDVRAGEFVAIVGPSGAGKSTLAALMSRLYDPTSGRVMLEGVPLTELDPSWLRSSIGVVSQEPVLFSVSVEDNVRFGCPSASDSEVRRALRAANAEAFVEAFPDGVRTRVGDRGQQLSGGQKQRIAVARALLKDPRILLLDEATSALDAEAEALVQEAMRVLMKGRTSLVIAHRLSTVARADRVVVLDRGQMVEEGPHDALISRGGVYTRLVERQILRA